MTSTHRAKGARKPAAGLPLLVSCIQASEEEVVACDHRKRREGGREGGKEVWVSE
jgi:hypothetical protein